MFFLVLVGLVFQVGVIETFDGLDFPCCRGYQVQPKKTLHLFVGERGGTKATASPFRQAVEPPPQVADHLREFRFFRQEPGRVAGGLLDGFQLLPKDFAVLVGGAELEAVLGSFDKVVYEFCKKALRSAISSSTCSLIQRKSGSE